MAFLGLSHTTKTPARAVIDVGSDSIKAVIFAAGSGEKPPQIFKKMVAKLPVAVSQERTITKLREFLFVMVKELGRVPQKITVALGPQIAEHRLLTWSVRPAEKGPLSREMLRRYFQNLIEQNREGTRHFTAHPVALFDNGYKVDPSDLESASIYDLWFRTLLLYFPGEVGRVLADAKKILGGMPIEFIPAVLAYEYAIVRSLNVAEALTVVVDGEETTILYIQDGTIVGVAVFPMGARHFLRKISQVTNSSFLEAEDVKRQYASRMLDAGRSQKLQEHLGEEVSLWRKMFLDELDGFYHLGPIPEQIFLTGKGALLPELQAVLRDAEWIKQFSYSVSPRVKIFEAQGLFQGNTMNGLLRGVEESGLASLIIYSLHHEPIF
ncbi:MAG: hypothetical protein HYW89_03795 [Candidatus Sungiibacteriota bacterium]|uniref:SHS2 domain-containing protein n=1 Tax=Candidatus Sungiibacteriota bacterium TaxID=2750080 RepID=A0A7T5URY7_9BACT|nr:MAG: hypothetical protein HYW89_03795 [Candidatus Sungbacteria bacterium]